MLIYQTRLHISSISFNGKQFLNLSFKFISRRKVLYLQSLSRTPKTIEITIPNLLVWKWLYVSAWPTFIPITSFKMPWRLSAEEFWRPWHHLFLNKFYLRKYYKCYQLWQVVVYKSQTTNTLLMYECIHLRYLFLLFALRMFSLKCPQKEKLREVQLEK